MRLYGKLTAKFRYKQAARKFIDCTAQYETQPQASSSGGLCKRKAVTPTVAATVACAMTLEVEALRKRMSISAIIDTQDDKR